MIDWLFRDRETGEIVIAQAPNLPLWLTIGALLVRALVPDGRWHDVLTYLFLGGLVWWAADELVRGVNPWRRVLGVVGLALAAGSLNGLLT